MSREIKFRAWVTGTSTMVDWDALYQNDREGLCTLMDYITAPDCIVMQYTGLKDKNGKEIYEGDIVRYEMPGPPPDDLMIEYIEPIIFSVASFDVEGAPLYVVSDVCEVIGNIHQNPELLK